MRARMALCLALLSSAGCGSSSSTAAEPFYVLVTNDDGVGAPGISALVEALRDNAHLAVHVYAPSTNQSGSGDSISTSPLLVTPATTAAGFPATAVAGTPADSALFGLLQGLGVSVTPDLVVSGINAGQNVAEYVYISGTVGAARWAARNGIPALAVSQAFPADDYAAAAAYTAKVVERVRTDPAFRRALRPPDASQALILNLNFPTCTTGAARGVEVVPVGRTSQVVSYELILEAGDEQTFQPLTATTNPFIIDCTGTLTDPSSDAEALANGFAAATPLGPDLTQETVLDSFAFLENL